jgi:hypothetical protein
MRFIAALLAASVLASATGCASLEANSQWYRTQPDPCAGRPHWGQDPLCGNPPV